MSQTSTITCLQNCIAQTPIEPRDASRMLVLHRDKGAIEHRQFRDLPDYLQPPAT